MPTLLPIRAPALSLFDHAAQVWLAICRMVRAAGDIARGVWLQEQQGPRRQWRDYVGLEALRTLEGRSVSAREAEAQSWNL